MNWLARRMALMDLYGLRLEEKDLFGKEDGHQVTWSKEKVQRYGRDKKRPTHYHPKKHPKELRVKVVLEALEATQRFRSGQRGRNQAIEDVAKKHGLPGQTVRRWMRNGYHR